MLLHFTSLPPQMSSHPPWHSIRIWDTGGWEPSERSSKSNPSDFQGESEALQHVHRICCRCSSSCVHVAAVGCPSSARGAGLHAHPDKPRQECNGQGPSAWKDLKIAKGQHKWLVASKKQVLNSFLEHPHHFIFIPSKPEVIHLPTPLCSPGGEQQGGRATSTLMSFLCTSKHPNPPIS